MSRKSAETCQCCGELRGEFAGERFELAPVDAADDGGLVDQRAEFVGGGKQRGGRQAFAVRLHAPCLDQARERAAALGRGEGGRQVERVGAEGGEAVFFLDVAERADLGRQQRAVHRVDRATGRGRARRAGWA